MKRNEKAMTIAAVCIVILALCRPGTARTIYVANDAPADFNTIQAAIDHTINGDTVVILPGTYTGRGNRDISIKSRVITVQSVDPNDPNIVRGTVIDCQGTENEHHRGFYFSNAKDAPTSILDGLTIIHGYAPEGGGIFCYDYASPTIRNCRLISNHAIMRGGGLYIGSGTPIIRNCVILNNSVLHRQAEGTGGGIYCGWASVMISGCTIAGNSAFSSIASSRGAGGGIYVSGDDVTIRHCTVVENTADSAGGISTNGSATIIIADCIVRSNIAPKSPQIGGAPSVSYSNVEGGWSGLENIDADPLFVAPASGDYHLSAGSPCIDAGDPQYVAYSDQTDIDNEPRVMGARADMGIDEFTSTPTAVLNVYPKQLVFHTDVSGSAPQRQVLHIRNAGFAPLTWAVAEDSPWLDVVEPVDGIEGVSLGIDPVGLNPGQYDCQVMVTADHVPNSPQLVTVSLYVRAGKYLHVPGQYPTIQSAIESAWDGDTVVIAEGDYTGPGNRDIDFLGKAITVRSVDPTDPAVAAATIVRCGGTTAEPHRGFMFRSGEDANSILAGLTITGGLSSNGGGVYMDGSSPTILCCNIIGNVCTSYGSGVFVRLGSPYIGQCLIMENRGNGSLVRGGGIYCDGSPIIVDCTIRSNQARSHGGGVFSGNGSPVLSGCVIADNRVEKGGGGGICFWGGKGALDHCLVIGNRAGDIGGGMYVSGSESTVRNCTIARNMANNSGGGIEFSLGKLSLANTILWGNTAPQGPGIAVYAYSGVVDARGDFYRLSGTVDILACDIQGGQSKVYITGDPRCLQFNWGTDNIDIDPLFADPANSDCHLKSQAGRWEAGSGSWVIDEITSPCIDAGDPNSPVGDEPQPNGGRVNMGAYGGTAEASKSYGGE